MRRAGGDRRDTEVAQPFATLADDGKLAEDVDVLHVHVGARCQPVFPFGEISCVVAHASDLEVRRAVIRHDPEVPVAVLHVVLDVGAAGGDDPCRSCRMHGVNHARVTLGEAASRNGDELAAAQALHADVEKHVRLVVHADVGAH